MSEHNERSSKDCLMEAYYMMIGEAHVENIVEELSLKAEEIEQVTVPKSLDNWFESFEKRRKRVMNRKKRMKKIRKASSRAALFLLIVLTCMTVVTFSVDAFRIRFYNFFFEENEGYTEIDKREDDTNQNILLIDQEIFYYLAYLPSGYSYDRHTIIGDETVIQYTNGDETIIFNQDKGNANYQIDTEDAIVSEIPLGDSSGQLIKKDGQIMLFWVDNEDSFLIKASITEQEIIMIAENLKKNK